MLPEWLAPHDVDRLERNHFGKTACARPAAAIDALPVCTWQTLGDVERNDPGLARLAERFERVLRYGVIPVFGRIPCFRGAAPKLRPGTIAKTRSR
jgi:hypothetical protein